MLGMIAVLVGKETEFTYDFARYLTQKAKERFICIKTLQDTNKVRGQILDGYIVLDGFSRYSSLTKSEQQAIVGIIQSCVR